MAPADRPHFRFWPRLLPRGITLPQTSLAANLEISALRYPDKPAFIYGDLGRADSLQRAAQAERQARVRADARRRLAGAPRRWRQRRARVGRRNRTVLDRPGR